MISARARDSFDREMRRAMRDSMAGPDDAVDSVVKLAGLNEVQARQSILVSLSTYSFKALTLLHFDLGDPVRQHFARLHRMDPGQLADDGLLDLLSERANMLCGLVNRSLGPRFPHMGMSTPHRIHRNSLAHLQMLRPDHVSHHEMVINGESALYASLCVCAHGTLDFELPAVTEDVVSGELEMF